MLDRTVLGRRDRLVVAGLLLLLAWPVQCPGSPHRSASVFQVSTIGALMRGLYTGCMTFAELRRHGNLGIGTFDQVDGEMILLDGRFYQARSDGSIQPVKPDSTTPFATVTNFSPVASRHIAERLSLEKLEARLAEHGPGRNAVCAYRIDGLFELVRVRSVQRQIPPYRPLSEVAKSQATFERTKVRGTLVGFRTPDYIPTLNVPGLHVHFLSADRAFGGHVLQVVAIDVRASYQVCSTIEVSLPQSEAFHELDLRDEQREALSAVERARR